METMIIGWPQPFCPAILHLALPTVCSAFLPIQLACTAERGLHDHAALCNDPATLSQPSIYGLST